MYHVGAVLKINKVRGLAVASMKFGERPEENCQQAFSINPQLRSCF